MDPVQNAIVVSLSKYRVGVLTHVLKLLRYIDLHFEIKSKEYYVKLGLSPDTPDLRTIDTPTIDNKIYQIIISNIQRGERENLTLIGNKIKNYIRERNEEGGLPDNIENTEESKFNVIYPIVYNRWQPYINSITAVCINDTIDYLSKILEKPLLQPKIGGFPVTESDRTLIRIIELHVISQLRLQPLLLLQPELQQQQQQRRSQLPGNPRVTQQGKPMRIGGKRPTRRRPHRKSTKRIRRRRTPRTTRK